MRKRVLTISGIAIFFFLFYFLKLIFSGNIILPQYFNLGPVTIHYYGIIMAAAVAAGFYFALNRAPKYGVNLKTAEDLIFWIIIGGFIGARLYHVLSAWNFYSSHPADILKVWNGGLAIYGAVFGGLLTLWVHKRLSTFHGSFLTLLDWLTPSLILGQIIGRFGNLFNYEAFGYPTSLPWKMFVPAQFRPWEYLNFNFFHPFFLYEVLGNIVILFFLLKIAKFKAPGRVFISYLLLYNTLRFALEFLRIDSTFVHGFRLNALMSLSLVLLAVVTLFYLNRHAQKP